MSTPVAFLPVFTTDHIVLCNVLHLVGLRVRGE